MGRLHSSWFCWAVGCKFKDQCLIESTGWFQEVLYLMYCWWMHWGLKQHVAVMPQKCSMQIQNCHLGQMIDKIKMWHIYSFTYLRHQPSRQEDTVQTVRANLALQQQASARNRRLAAQMERRPAVMAALKIKQVLCFLQNLLSHSVLNTSCFDVIC